MSSLRSHETALAALCGLGLGASLAWHVARRVSAPEREGAPAEEPRRNAPGSCSCDCGPFALPAQSTPDPFDTRPRTTFLSWDDYFMAIAFLSAQRSKDPKKQVGACIVNSERVIVGIGYNGFPRGCPDESLPWAKLSASGDVLQTKVPYVVHAEANAILNKNASTLVGSHLYVTMYPCCECAKLIIQSGIRQVTYSEAKTGKDGGAPDPLYVAAAKMLSLAGVRVAQHRAEKPLRLDLFSGVAKARP